MNYRRKHSTPALTGLGCLIMVLFVVLWGALEFAVEMALVYYGWNLALAPLFGAPHITLGMAIGLTLLLDVLFRFMRYSIRDSRS